MPRAHGALRRPTACSRVTADGTARGWRSHDYRAIAERGDAVAVPPPSPSTPSCRTVTPAPWSGWTVSSTGCACRASTRPASSARCSTGGIVPVCAVRHQRADRPRLCARDQRVDDDLEDASAAGSRSVMPLTMSPRAGGGRGHAAHPAAGGRRRRPRSGAHRPLHRRQRRGRGGVRAVFDYGRTAADWTLDEDRHTAVTSRRGPDDPPAHRPGPRHRGQPGPRPSHADAGEAVYCALAWGPASSSPPMWTRPTTGWPPPSASGGRGAGATPTIVGVTRSSARP